MKISLTFLVILLGSAFSAHVPGSAIKNARVLYPYGEAVGDMKTPKEDDGTSPEFHMSKPFTFYGRKHDSLYVNNNGVVSFSNPVPEYTPEPIPLDDKKPFVAPYWGDVNTDLGGEVYYRETTNPEELEHISQDINQYYPDSHFKADWAFIATWDKVAYFGSASNKVNTFQAVLANDDNAAYVMLNYGKIQWTTGTASGGNPRTGLGGIPAQAGFNSGDDKNYFSIPGSRTDEILNIGDTSNVNVPGRWVFQVNEGIPKEVLQKIREAEAAKKAAEEAAKKAAEEAAKKAAEEAAKKAAEEAAKKAEEEAARKAAEEAAKKAAEEAAKKAAEEAAKKAAEEAAKKAAEEAAKKAEEEAAKKAAEEAAKKAAEEAAKKAAEEAAKKAEEEAAKKAAEEAAKKAAEEAAKKAAEEAAKKAAEEAAKKAEEEAAKKPVEEAPKEEEQPDDWEEYEDCEEEEEEYEYEYEDGDLWQQDEPVTLEDLLRR
uniref:NIDO domain-containing protein n=1 Tax=Pogona vitticeps TaxID=103695 RepID=A0ABM5ERY7_9SAUR